MDLLNFEKLDFFLKCFLLNLFCYSSLTILTDFSISFLIIPTILFLLLSVICLNPSEEQSVNFVLGPDLRTQFRYADNSESLRSTINNSNFSIAYRCAPFNSAQNNLNAIRQCSKNDCKFIHFDVKFTMDNVAVITRDTTVLLSKDDILIEKFIEECCFNEIKENNTLDIYGGTTREMIPTLTETITLCQSLEMKMMINVIHSNYYTSTDPFINNILEMFDKNESLYSSCVLSSSSPCLLYRIRKKNNRIVTAFHWLCISQSSVSSISWLKNNINGNRLYGSLLDLVDIVGLWFLNNFIHRIIGFSIIILPKHLINSAVVEFWERKKIRCMATIVNLPVEKEYYKSGLGIAYLTEVLDSYNKGV